MYVKKKKKKNDLPTKKVNVHHYEQLGCWTSRHISYSAALYYCSLFVATNYSRTPYIPAEAHLILHIVHMIAMTWKITRCMLIWDFDSCVFYWSHFLMARLRWFIFLSKPGLAGTCALSLQLRQSLSWLFSSENDTWIINIGWKK